MKDWPFYARWNASSATVKYAAGIFGLDLIPAQVGEGDGHEDLHPQIGVERFLAGGVGGDRRNGG